MRDMQSPGSLKSLKEIQFHVECLIAKRKTQRRGKQLQIPDLRDKTVSNFGSQTYGTRLPWLILLPPHPQLQWKANLLGIY